MKKRKCSKGHSCGAACISRNRVCKKGFSKEVENFLDKKAPEGHKEAYEKRADLRSRFIEAEEEYDFDAQIKLQKELIDFSKSRFKESPDRRTFSPIVRREPSEELIEMVKKNAKDNPIQTQADIYEALNYNAKPDLVDSREALIFNENIVTGRGDDLPMILYRGVNNVKYQDDLREGDRHYVGSGKVGNGTYAAGGDRQDLDIYTSSMADAYGNDKIAFGIKKDAKLFRGDDLEAEATKIAKKFGLNPKEVDTGILMSLGGWDAYLAKGDVNEQNEYVILNRASMVISKENITESFAF